MNGIRGVLIGSIMRTAFAALAWHAASVGAQDGVLDPTFGSGGIVEIPWPAGSAEGNAIGIAPQGKIIIGGHAIGAFGDSDFTLFRLSPNGAVDPTYAADAGGFRLIDFNLDGIGSYSDDLIDDLALYPDGSVLALGEAHFGFFGVNSQFALTRLDSGGTLDSTFGDDGSAHFASGSFSNIDYGRLLRIDDQQRILAVGMIAEPSTDVPGSLRWWLGFSRLTAQGQFDSSFYNEGFYFTFFWSDPTIPPPRHSDFNSPLAVALDDSSRILSAGYVENPIAPGGAVYRAPVDGGFDPTFGLNSRIQLELSGGQASALHPLPGGAFLVAGGYATGSNTYAIYLARRLTDGSPDVTFGEQGMVSLPMTDAYPEPSLIEKTRDGGWLVAGRLTAPYADGMGVVLARFTAQGQPQTSFGAGGLVVIDANDGRHFTAGRAAMQDDGKLVIAGHLANSLDDSTPHFAILRILADFDTLFVNGFDGAP